MSKIQLNSKLWYARMRPSGNSLLWARSRRTGDPDDIDAYYKDFLLTEKKQREAARQEVLVEVQAALARFDRRRWWEVKS